MKVEDWQERRLNYFDLAHRLHKAKNNFLPALEEAQRCQLEEYKAGKYLKKVEILVAPDSCPLCAALSPKILSIQQALKTKPIPVKKCNRGFCRCVYAPVIDL